MERILEVGAQSSLRELYEVYDHREAVKLPMVRNGLIPPLSARTLTVLCDASTVFESRSPYHKS